MSNITSNTVAAATAVRAENKQFKPGAEVLPRKILIIGTGNPTTEAGNVINEPVLATSAQYIGSLTGFGYMLHRLAQKVFSGSGGIETWFIQQPENVAAVQATGEIDFTGSAGAIAGTLALFFAGHKVQVTTSSGMTIENITDACVAAINSDDDCPVSAAKHAVTFELDLTAKTGGPWGNDISIETNLDFGDLTPTDIVITITGMTGGAGLPDIQDALDSLGTGDGANEAYFTDVIHGYGQDTTTLNAIADYVGQGNTAQGLYDEVVHRPFRSLVGDVATGAAGLSALVALGNSRKQDRASGIIAVPNSPNSPHEIAALTIGNLARISNDRPEKNYLGIILEGIYPGSKTDRWTSEHTNRDIAVKAGISSTKIESGYVVLQNVVTFYHPDDVPRNSNGWADMVDIAVMQNITHNWALNYSSANWQGKSIVADATKVSIIPARLNTVDIDSYRNDAVALFRSFEANAWIFEAEFSINALKEPGAISIRPGGNGFNAVIKIIRSGKNYITDSRIQFDTSIASLLS